MKYVDSSMMSLQTHWLEDLDQPMTCECIGWLIIDNPDYITICMEHNSESKGLRFVLSIPRCSILEIRNVSIGEKRDSPRTALSS